jgi:hypothetical protein
MPRPCRAAKGLDSVFPIWFTQCGRVWFTHAMPCQCHATTMPFWKRLLKATAQRGMAWHWHGTDMCELTSAVQRRHVGYLPAFGFFRLPRGDPRSLLSDAYQSVKLQELLVLNTKIKIPQEGETKGKPKCDRVFPWQLCTEAVAYRGGFGGSNPPPPINSEVLKKLSQIPSSVENTSVT